MNNPVIITGGAQRLGLAMAIALKAEGYEVLVTFRSNTDNLPILEKSDIDYCHADFSTPEGVQSFINFVQQNCDSIRAIVHNASDWASETGCNNHHALFQRMMQVHANAPYQINLACQSLLESSEGLADIIHMTDFVQQKGSKKHLAYAASKAALHNLTLSFSALFAPKIKVNSIAPALLMFNQSDTEHYRQRALQKSLLQTCPGADEASKAVSYLLSSEYITGRTLHLDGGRHLK